MHNFNDLHEKPISPTVSAITKCTKKLIILNLPNFSDRKSLCMDQTDPKAEVMHVECYRKRLNFNAPILSIKRPGGYNDYDHDHDEEVSHGAAHDTGGSSSSRIPFSWEHAPGKPKKTNGADEEEAETPRPRLPPSRWHPNIDHRHQDYTTRYEDGCDGDDENGVFSDAVDLLSLSEAMDFIEKSEKIQGLDRLISEMGESYKPSPNFIMERFLPDASVLAASSALAASKNMIRDFPYNINSPSEACVSRQFSSSSWSSRKAGCGLERLFPWRMKHKICGVKSPVRQQYSSIVTSSRSKQNKQSSSDDISRFSSTDVNKDE